MPILSGRRFFRSKDCGQRWHNMATVKRTASRKASRFTFTPCSALSVAPGTFLIDCTMQKKPAGRVTGGLLILIRSPGVRGRAIGTGASKRYDLSQADLLLYVGVVMGSP